MLQAMSPVAWLPPFEAWAGGGLPYWLLVLCQVLVIMVCGRVMWRLHAGLIVPTMATGKALLCLGALYFGLMWFRLIMGMTVATDHKWFSARLPTLFHFVLAGFVLVYGWFHYKAAGAIHPRSQGKTE
ncbi:MAG: hypothetical protein NNA21_09420 [Nitrospira sp.]|nr:hypothetical protein [Nitrospira sp.]MCP9461019.1 hypothetical protein [Nitrospira sp.]MCP9475309.1 hypothetical protein [Nitrospira sp.]